ncbi:FkbM family methyltransferase [Pedobacter heparinus]|uniref:FkbM family methyltransferase n=1 Tax=Pedobacter heparinus TaxID=984 RepID=UPI0029303244|nr:FkbM family methyltransferase [Pedobacter heparinus]
MKIIRMIALKFLKLTARDIIINHHYTGKKLVLNSYYHKGYWYYGKKREETTMNQFKDIIKKGDFVLEIGGHIGYITTFFASLVGEKGRVLVFEPGSNNLPYLKKNISYYNTSNIKIEEKGAGDHDGIETFFLDPLTGQNNSFVKDFDGFYINRQQSVERESEYMDEKVEMMRLDSYFAGKSQLPNFVKIDVEGFELNVIKGFLETIKKNRPEFMIEIQKDESTIINLFKDLGYKIQNENSEEILNYEDYLLKMTPNIFFLNRN